MRFVILAVLLLVTCPASADEKPNILIILCDDLGYGDLGCFGHPTISTPNLDALADQGWRLTDCYAASPVCSPSRTGLMTGRTPSRAGVFDWIPNGNIMHMPAREITIAQRLKSAGYDTALIGKWHCNGKFNNDAQPQPGDFGFDHWFATQNNASPTHRNPRNFVRNGEPTGQLEGFSSHIVATEGIRWLHERPDPSVPFFLQICFHEPHEPVDSPDELVKKYQSAGAEKKGEALYYANIEHMDAAVGKLIAALEELGAFENTLVFFTSDNGPETLNRYRSAWRSHGVATPLRAMKLWLYEGGIRVPGILRFPGQTDAGRIIETPISSLDLMPTLCALANISPPLDRPLDGTDFSPLFKGEPIDRSQPLFWHYYGALGEPKLAMRDGDWVLLSTVTSIPRPNGGSFSPTAMPTIKSSQPDRFELYNLRDDIKQQHDRATECPERLKRMAEQLTSIWMDVREEAHDWSKNGQLNREREPLPDRRHK